MLFVLKTGIPREDFPWADVPQEMDCCGMALVNRLRWRAAGAWQLVHERLPAELRAAGRIDFGRVIADASFAPFARAMHGARTEPILVDWRKHGPKHHPVRLGSDLRWR